MMQSINILKELCYQADKFDIILSLSAVFSPNGIDPIMDTKRLVQWYERFGFTGESGLSREPNR